MLTLVPCGGGANTGFRLLIPCRPHPQVRGADPFSFRSHRRHRSCGRCGQPASPQVSRASGLCVPGGRGGWTTGGWCGRCRLVHTRGPRIAALVPVGRAVIHPLSPGFPQPVDESITRAIPTGSPQAVESVDNPPRQPPGMARCVLDGGRGACPQLWTTSGEKRPSRENYWCSPDRFGRNAKSRRLSARPCGPGRSAR